MHLFHKFFECLELIIDIFGVLVTVLAFFVAVYSYF